MSVETATLTDTRDMKTRRIAAALASALLPGAGQWIHHEKKQAAIFLAFFLAAVSLFWPVRIVTHYYGWILAVIFILLVILTSSCVGLLQREPTDKSVQNRALWLFLVVPLAIVSSLLWVTGLQHITGLRAFNVSSTSMEKTIFQGDSIAADFRYYEHRSPQRGEIVVIRHNGIFIIKRVIGLGGDTISSADGKLLVNGVIPDEPYVQHVGNPAPTPEMNTFAGITVPSGKIFVLGDNRDVSLDSRMPEFGFVADTDVLGKVSFVAKSAHDQTGRSF
jgi:signal peptidase I